MRQDNVLVFQSLEGAARFLASVSVFLSWNEDCCQLQVTFVGGIVQLKHGKSQIWMINGTEIELFAQQWSSGTWNPNGWNPFCSRGFCDVKFQNWLFETPISGPPRSGAVKRQWKGSDRFWPWPIWKTDLRSLGCFGVPASPTWDSAHQRWLAGHSIPFAGTHSSLPETRRQSSRIWEIGGIWEQFYRGLLLQAAIPPVAWAAPTMGLCELPAASAMLLHSFPRGRRGLGGCRDVWGGLPTLLPSPQGPIPPGSTGTGRAPGFLGFLQMVSPSCCLHQPLPTWSVCCGELGLLGRSQSTGWLWKLSPFKNNCRLQWFPQVTTKECPCVSLGLCALFRAFFGWTRSLQVAAEEQWRAFWRSYLWAAGRSICGRWPCWLRCVILPFWSWFMLLEGSWYWDGLLLWFCEVLCVGEENVLST